MVEDLSKKILAAISEIQSSSDPEIFVKKLLRDTLRWPIEIDDLEEFDFDELGYDWNEELESMDLKSEEGITDLFQIARFPGWPVGIFVVKFGSNSIFTKGRGMTTPLRNLLKNLVEKVRPTAAHETFSQDQLLFLCHHEHQYFEFARFTDIEGENLPKMQSFGWGPDDDYRTLCTHNLPFLVYEPHHSQQEVLAELGKAFDVEKVTKRFYNDYKSTFIQFMNDLIRHAELEYSDEIHRHVQLIFNRFLFLRFIEKKGWLNFGDDSNYLLNLFNHSNEQTTNFYADHFLPMALDGLAVKGKQSSELYGEVQLIGGGLFEETPLDKEIKHIPNELFETIIGNDGLLYRYNFTVQESTPLDIQVAIDPEMIGTMFEELVTDRDGKGAFYTPRVVVSYMCKEGLKSILEEKTDVSSEKLRQLIDEGNPKNINVPEAKQIREELDDLKAIDPACGSGAYLLGLLQEIVNIHEKLQTLSTEFDRTKYDLKLHIIRRTIFGADLDPFATQIAMLRLWLTLAVESDVSIQLPNLDFNIETGDALLAPDPSLKDWFNLLPLEAADRLDEKKEFYLDATENIKQLRREIKEEEGLIRAALRRGDDLIGSVDFRVQFAGVFSKKGGFDLVLANPPYVRQRNIGKEFYKKLQRKFQAKKTSAATKYPITGQSDLYCYFFIRFNQLLRTNGVQLTICSNTWMDAEFGFILQDYFLKNNQIIKFVDSATEKQFSTAEVNTVISIMKKAKVANYPIRFEYLLDDFTSSVHNDGNKKIFAINRTDLEAMGGQDGHYSGLKWMNFFRAPSIYWEMLELLSGKLTSVGDLGSLSRGITSGADEFFYLKENEISQWAIEERFLIPFMKSAIETKHTVPRKETCAHSFFYCNLAKPLLGGTKALEYIQWGETSELNLKGEEIRAFHKRASFQSKPVWYTLKKRESAPLLLPWSVNDIYRCFLNPDNMIVGQRIYEFIPVNKQLDLNVLHSIMNSTITSFFIEMSARSGLGQGLLPMSVAEVKKLQIINPSCFPSLPSIEREIGNLEHELKQADRLELDSLLFDYIGLSAEKRIEFYVQFQNVVDNRLGKSHSVTES
jgi:type I restriction-modification system DNA methylase subunit